MSSIDSIGSSGSTAASQYQAILAQNRANRAAAEAKNDPVQTSQAEKANSKVDADSDGD